MTRLLQFSIPRCLQNSDISDFVFCHPAASHPSRAQWHGRTPRTQTALQIRARLFESESCPYFRVPPFFSLFSFLLDFFSLFSFLPDPFSHFSFLFSLFSRLFLLDSADTACRVRYPVLNALGNYWITPLLVSLVLCPPRVCLLVRAEPLSLFFFAAVLTVISTSVPCRAPVCEISIFESGDRCMVENLSVSLTEQSAYVAVRL